MLSTWWVVWVVGGEIRSGIMDSCEIMPVNDVISKQRGDLDAFGDFYSY